jgi:hypothetical protein
MTAITTKLQEIITIPINALLTAQAERYDIDLSIPALFNGIIATDLPQDGAWSLAYQ